MYEVFKFCHPDRIDILTKGRIRFTQPIYLNDLFDSNPFYSLPVDKEIDNVLKEAKINPQKPLENFKAILDKSSEYLGKMLRLTKDVEKARSNMIKDVYSGVREGLGILSLSHTSDENLIHHHQTHYVNDVRMWGHYADSGKGFKLGFDPKHPYFKNKERKGNDYRKMLDILTEVKYCRDRQEVDSARLGKDIQGLTKQKASFHLTKEIFGIVYYHKDEKWEYESEIRMIKNILEADKTISCNGEIISLFNIPSCSISSITFGPKMSQRTIAQFIEILNEDRFRHIWRYKTSLCPKEYKILPELITEENFSPIKDPRFDFDD